MNESIKSVAKMGLFWNDPSATNEEMHLCIYQMQPCLVG